MNTIAQHRKPIARCLSLLFVITASLLGCSSKVSLDPPAGTSQLGVVRLDKATGKTPGPTPDLPNLFDSRAAYDPAVNQMNAQSKAHLVDPAEMALVDSTKVLDDKPAWDVKPDLTRYSYEMAKDFKLDISLETSRYPKLLTADLNGAFVVVADLEKPLAMSMQKSTSKKKKPKSDEQQYDVVEESRPNFTVYDLRTGRPSGQFSWKAPVGLACALSPNGKQLVARYHVAVDPKVVDVYKYEELKKADLAALYVWEVDKPNHSQKLDVKGFVEWFGFVSVNEVAVYVGLPQSRQLQFWNIQTGKQRAVIDLLPGVDGTPSTTGTPYQSKEFASYFEVSPRGQYLATVIKEKLVLISSAKALVEGEAPLECELFTHRTIRFSDDATTIAVAHGLRERECRFTLFDAANGRRTYQRDLKSYSPGQLIWHTTNGFVLSGSKRSETVAVESFGQPNRIPTGYIRVMDGGNVLALQDDATQLKLFVTEREQIEQSLVEMGPLEHAHGGRSPTKLDETQMQNVPRDAVQQWKPLDPIKQSPLCNIEAMPGVPWQSSFGSKTIGLFLEKVSTVRDQGTSAVLKQTDNTTSFVQLDAATGKVLGQPIEVRSWQGQGNRSEFPTAMSPDDQLIAVGDPNVPTRLRVYSQQGVPKLLCEALDQPIDWMGFLSDSALLVSGGGKLKRLSLQANTVSATYVTEDRNYGPPYHLPHDAKYLIVSRGQALDIVDTATGKNVAALGIDAKGSIADFCVSPDGKRLAAVYSENAQQIILHNVVETQNVTLAVWDLATGHADSKNLASPEFVGLCWLAPELICVCDNQDSTVYDLKLQAETVHYVANLTNESGDGKRPEKVKLARAVGQIWNIVTDDKGSQLSRRLPMGQTQAEKPFYSPEREIKALKSTPVTIEIDVAKCYVGKDHGVKLAKLFEDYGYLVGPGGLVARITHRTVDSDKIFEIADKQVGKSIGSDSPKSYVFVPKIEYTWELKAPNGSSFWSAKNYGNFVDEKSRFYNRIAGQWLFPIDTPKEVIAQKVAEEIVEQESGLKVPEQLPASFVQAGDVCSLFPQRFVWHDLETKSQAK